MEVKIEAGKLLHDLESKTASLKGAVKLLRECQPDERREMLTLMKTAAQEISSCLTELEKLDG